MIFPTDVAWMVFSPPLILLITACIAVIFALYRTDSRPVALLSLGGLGVSFFFNDLLFARSRNGEMLDSFGLRYLADHPALAFNVIILIGTALAVLISYDYLRRADLEQPEYYPLILLSATGAMVMVAAGDLITLLLGLEITSLAVYVLAAWRQNARESEEAGMKYFLLGAFASAFFVYGMALMYGATGQFAYTAIFSMLLIPGFDAGFLASIGGVMILAALAFKASLAPFHQWAPDAYTGAPTSVTAYMSVVVKTAAFAAILRIFSTVFPAISPTLITAFSVLVALTLVVGNFGALMQRGVKRMLAYSAVAHAGYLGLAVLAAGTLGTRAAIWYLLAYTLMNAGAFAVLTLVTDKNDKGDDLERFAGLGRKKPFLAAMMTLFLLSLAGIPPLAGFAGKVLVFQAAIASGYIMLAVLGIITSAVAIVYYFRVIAYMYFREAEYEPQQVPSRATRIAVLAAAFGTVALGLFPGMWYDLLRSGQQILAGL